LDGDSHAVPLPHDVARVAAPIDDHRVPVALAGVRCRRLRAGEILIHEGWDLGSLAVVQAGALTLAITTRGGRRAVVGVLGPGDVLGEDSIRLQVDREPHRPAGPSSMDWSKPPRRPVARPEARALTAGAVILLRPHELERAVRHDPSLAGWVAQSLSHRLADLQLRLGWALSLGVHERILGVLRSLVGRWGSPAPQGTMVDLPLSQDLLASMVGASRETVNRALRDLRASGVVVRSGRRYVVAGSSG
jgi:CRP/FNR family transcriptional regulator, cyclic AMP receptor protein